MTSGFYFDARVLDVGAARASHIPTLSIKISLKAGTGGSGEHIEASFGDGDVWVVPAQIQAFLFWNPADRTDSNWRNLVAMGFPQSMSSSTINMGKGEGACYDLLFPLSPGILSQMEESRPADKARYGITLRITGTIVDRTKSQSVTIPVVTLFAADQIWVYKQDWNDTILEIERSKWVDEVLPGLGVGSWMVYEVPMENFEGVAQVDAYLDNAWRQFVSHEWKLSMAACRDVVESLERELGATANSAYRDRYGNAEKKMRSLVQRYQELIGSMLEFQSSVKSLLAAGAHPERPEELVERPDAELALMIALALRRYVGMRLWGAGPPGFSPPSAKGGNVEESSPPATR